jgi:hypothetical protein
MAGLRALRDARVAGDLYAVAAVTAGAVEP